MRRVLLAAALVAACATVDAPSTRVAGCWLDMTEPVTTMRWRADLDHPQDHPGRLLGSLSRWNGSVTTSTEAYSLTPNGESWTLCQNQASGETCWQVALAESGSLEGGRAFIDAQYNSLRISVIGDRDERVIFDGYRRHCK